MLLFTKIRRKPKILSEYTEIYNGKTEQIDAIPDYFIGRKKSFSDTISYDRNDYLS